MSNNKDISCKCIVLLKEELYRILYLIITLVFSTYTFVKYFFII